MSVSLLRLMSIENAFAPLTGAGPGGGGDCARMLCAKELTGCGFGAGDALEEDTFEGVSGFDRGFEGPASVEAESRQALTCTCVAWCKRLARPFQVTYSLVHARQGLAAYPARGDLDYVVFLC